VNKITILTVLIKKGKFSRKFSDLNFSGKFSSLHIASHQCHLMFCSFKKSFITSKSTLPVAFPFRDLQNKICSEIYALELSQTPPIQLHLIRPSFHPICRRPSKRSYLFRSCCPPARWCSFSTGPRCDSRRATECLLPAGRRNYTAVVSQSANMIFSQCLSVGGVNSR
jgi:hypothetical protein